MAFLLQNNLMTNKFQVNLENIFLKRRVSLTEKIQETEQQKRQFRTLQLIFQTNLNKFIRKNKQVFNGAVQTLPNKSYLNSEQYEANRKILQKTQTYMQRLMKGMLLRNNNLCKQQKSYQQGYRESSFTPVFQNPQNERSNKSGLVQSPLNLECQQTWQGQSSKKNLLRISLGQFRPFGLTIQNRKLQQNKSKERKYNTRPMSSQLSRQLHKRNTVNLKNVDINKIKIERDIRRIPLFRQSLEQINGFQKYQQEQVYIRKKMIPQNTIACQNRIMRSGSAFNGKKVETGGLTKNLNTKNQHLNFVEKRRLQNKIMMVNTVLAFNLNQTQGYKAKSKCWSNPIM